MAKLTAAKRDKLKKSTFAIPSKRAYPIPDPAHAKAALARVDQFGSSAEKKTVRAAIAKKFPSMTLSKGPSAKRSK